MNAHVARWGRALLLGLGILLSAPELLSIYVNTLPTELRNQAIDLHGIWQGRPGGGVAALEDTTGWKPIEVPGDYDAATFGSQMLWVRRDFEVSAAHLQQNLMLVVYIRHADIEVYVDGRAFGTMVVNRFERVKDNFRSTLVLPKEALSPGRHTLALHVRWWGPQYNYFSQGDYFIGPEGPTEDYVTTAFAFYAANTLYDVVSFALFMLLLLLFLFIGGDAAARRRQQAALGMCVASLLFLVSFCASAWAPPTMVIGPILLLLSTAEFLNQMGAVPLRRWLVANRFICVILAVLSLLPEPWLGMIYQTTSIYSFAGIGILIWAVVRFAILHHSYQNTFFAFVIASLGVVGICDFLGDMHLVSLPNLFNYGVVNAGLSVSIIMVSDFISIIRHNEVLSSSLAKTNTDLAAALSLAKEAARIKGQFLANMSHELRTPLNAIINMPDVLAKNFRRQSAIICATCDAAFELEQGEVLTAESVCPACSSVGTLALKETTVFAGEPTMTLTRLKSIKNAGLLLLDIVNDVLDFSQLESKRMVLRPQDFALRPLLDEVFSTMEGLATAREISLTCADVAPDIVLHADRLKLSQVLINLISNAIKFSPARAAVTLRVETGGGHVTLAVSDTGIGIAPEHHQLIFEAFRQVDSGHTRRYGGSGLGLAIAHEIVTLHGGTIGVESAEGQGSTFWVRLPQAPPQK